MAGSEWLGIPDKRAVVLLDSFLICFQRAARTDAMACNGATLGMADLHSSGNDTDVVFASPSRIAGPKLDEVDPPPQATEQHSRTLEEREVNDEEARDVALGKELAGIRNINQVIEGVIDGLERAGGNMDVRPHRSPSIPFNLYDM